MKIFQLQQKIKYIPLSQQRIIIVLENNLIDPNLIGLKEIKIPNKIALVILLSQNPPDC